VQRPRVICDRSAAGLMVCDRPLIALFPITRAPLRRTKNNNNTKYEITIVIRPLYYIGWVIPMYYLPASGGGGKSKQRARLLDR